MLGQYKLVHRTPVLCKTREEWYRSMDDKRGRRKVRTHYMGNVWVSTVFLGLDHAMIHGGNEPLVFETMIFVDGSMGGDYQARCSTWRQALEMHWTAVDSAEKEYKVSRRDGSNFQELYRAKQKIQRKEISKSQRDNVVSMFQSLPKRSE